MTANANAARRRDLRNEAPIVARTKRLEHLTELYDDLTEKTDCTAAEAAGICAWIMRKATGRPDTTSRSARARYRKRLSELLGEPYNQPGDGRPRHLGGVGDKPIIIGAPPYDALVRRALDEPHTATNLHAVK